ncbi:MAG: M48 family metallopeptidase [Halocynthiibacter sp.]
MLKFTPILLAVLYGLLMYRFSVWRTLKDLSENSTRLRDPMISSYLGDMAYALGVPEIPVHIYEIDPINGLAAPDGRVFITRGFYKAYSAGKITAEELTSVIAHELGHVALGHSKRRMIDFSGQNALRTALAMILGRFIPGLGIYIANLVTSVLAARLSQTAEFEADEYGAALLQKSGIGVAPQISMFEKLDQLTGGKRGATPAWLLSHPKTETRINALKKMQNKWNSA